MEEKNKQLAIEFLKRLTITPGSCHERYAEASCICMLSKNAISALFVLLDILIPAEEKKDFFEKLVALSHLTIDLALSWLDKKLFVEISKFNEQIGLEDGLVKFTTFLGGNRPPCIQISEIEKLIQSM